MPESDQPGFHYSIVSRLVNNHLEAVPNGHPDYVSLSSIARALTGMTVAAGIIEIDNDQSHVPDYFTHARQQLIEKSQKPIGHLKPFDPDNEFHVRALKFWRGITHEPKAQPFIGDPTQRPLATLLTADELLHAYVPTLNKLWKFARIFSIEQLTQFPDRDAFIGELLTKANAVGPVYEERILALYDYAMAYERVLSENPQ